MAYKRRWRPTERERAELATVNDTTNNHTHTYRRTHTYRQDYWKRSLDQSWELNCYDSLHSCGGPLPVLLTKPFLSLLEGINELLPFLMHSLSPPPLHSTHTYTHPPQGIYHSLAFPHHLKSQGCAKDLPHNTHAPTHAAFSFFFLQCFGFLSTNPDTLWGPGNVFCWHLLTAFDGNSLT